MKRGIERKVDGIVLVELEPLRVVTEIVSLPTVINTGKVYLSEILMFLPEEETFVTSKSWDLRLASCKSSEASDLRE